MKNVVFWDVRPCGSCKNLAPSHSLVSHHMAPFLALLMFLRSVFRLPVTDNSVPSSPILKFLKEPHGVTPLKTAFYIEEEQVA
jgi:hypothetical protein